MKKVQISLLAVFLINHLSRVNHCYAMELVKVPAPSELSGGGETALYRAAQEGNLRLVRECLEKDGTDLNTPDEFGNTPLHCALKNNFSEIAELLLSRGANALAQTNYGETTLHCAANAGKHLGELLIKRGVPINAYDIVGLSALWRAVALGNSEFVELLISSGAGVNGVCTTDGGTALHLVARSYTDFVQAENDDLKTDKSESGNAMAFLDIARILLLKGVDVGTLNKNGQSVFFEISPLKDKKAASDMYKVLIHYAVCIPTELFESEAIVYAMRLKAVPEICQFSTFPDASLPRKRICAFLIASKRFLVPRDIAYVILSKDETFKDDLLLCILPYLAAGLRRNCLKDCFRVIPEYIRAAAFEAIYGNTLNELSSVILNERHAGVNLFDLLDRELLFANISLILGLSDESKLFDPCKNFVKWDIIKLRKKKQKLLKIQRKKEKRDEKYAVSNK